MLQCESSAQNTANHVRTSRSFWKYPPQGIKPPPSNARSCKRCHVRGLDCREVLDRNVSRRRIDPSRDYTVAVFQVWALTMTYNDNGVAHILQMEER